MKKLNALSLFDGMSGARLALDDAGIKVGKYYSSEVDKYAIQIADKNHPQDTQYRLGDITKLKKKQLKKMKIGLLVGGSPCQGFSMAGKLRGSSTKDGVEVTTLKQYLKLKKQGFEFEGQSYLFWEYVRIWKIIKPKYFLLENVRVTKKWLPMFNKAMGVEPILINSSLLSAQNRNRFYWSNIPNITQPEDQGIMLKDILEHDVVEPMLSNIYGGFGETKPREHTGKSVTIRANSGGGAIPSITLKNRYSEDVPNFLTGDYDGKSRLNKGLININLNDKAKYLSTGSGHGNKFIVVKASEVNIDKSVKPSVAKNIEREHDKIMKSDKDFHTMGCTSGFQDNKVGLKKSPCLRAGNNCTYVLDNGKQMSVTLTKEKILELADNESVKVKGKKAKKKIYKRYLKKFKSKVLTIAEATKLGYIEVQNGDCFDLTQPKSKIRRGRCMKDKCNCLTTSHQYMKYDHPVYRKLTPLECERLQMIPDKYTEGVSNTQRYRMIGNGFTIKVISHILKGIM